MLRLKKIKMPFCQKINMLYQLATDKLVNLLESKKWYTYLFIGILLLSAMPLIILSLFELFSTPLDEILHFEISEPEWKGYLIFFLGLPLFALLVFFTSFFIPAVYVKKNTTLDWEYQKSWSELKR
jgi:hypothetical protein